MSAPTPTAVQRDKLERLLGGSTRAGLRVRLRRHFERRDNGETNCMLQLSRLNSVEYETLALLTGRPVNAARSLRLDIPALDSALQAAGIADSLRAALEALDGPIVSRAALRNATRAAWSAVANAPDRADQLRAWLQTSAASTLLKRLTRQKTARAEAQLASTGAVLRCLPAAGVTRAQLAAQTLGDAHALDAGKPIARLVLAVWRHIEGDTVVSPAKERARAVWSRAGVLVNELARPALALNLPVEAGSTPAGAPGEPAYLSLRRLLREPPRWHVNGTAVFVCENPNLLAIAADRLGVGCAPFVCTEGMPGAAQRTLLSQLARAGAMLRYHGDFDWAGIHIANFVLRSWPSQAWRMSARDYLLAAQSAPHAQRNLSASQVEATWDAALAPAMSTHGFAIAEEAVADPLVEDLAGK